MASTEKRARFDLTAANGAYYIYGNEALWSGAPSSTEKPSSGMSPEGSMLAFRFDASRRMSVTQVSPVAPHGAGGWGVQLYADRFAKPDIHRMISHIVIGVAEYEFSSAAWSG